MNGYEQQGSPVGLHVYKFFIIFDFENEIYDPTWYTQKPSSLLFIIYDSPCDETMPFHRGTR